MKLLVVAQTTVFLKCTYYKKLTANFKQVALIQEIVTSPVSADVITPLPLALTHKLCLPVGVYKGVWVIWDNCHKIQASIKYTGRVLSSDLKVTTLHA